MSDLTWKTSWETVVCYEDLLLPNQYHLKMHFDVATDDSDEQNVAFDRIKFFVDNVLQDSIFCQVDDPRIDFYMKSFKQKIVTFAHAPQDLTIVSHIYSKFNQITEGRLEIHDMELGSRLGNNITVNFGEDFFEDSGMLFDHEMIKAAEKSPWWFREDCGSADFFRMDEETKELAFVTDVSGWEDTGLTWPDQKGLKKEKGTGFDKSWKPTIIPGGKTQH